MTALKPTNNSTAVATQQLQQQPFQIHPLSVVRMLWKQKLLIVVVWLVVAAVGLALTRLIPNVYRSESLILVDSQKIPERFVASTVQVALQDHLATISQQILSTTQLEQIFDKFHLYEEERKSKSPDLVVARARRDIEIRLAKDWGDGRPGAFRIAYEGPDPVVVAGVVNELSGLFIAENLKARELRAEDTSAFIDSQLREARKALEEQEASVSRFKLQRMGELPQQEPALSGALSRLQAELQGNQDAIARAEQSKVLLEATLRSAESSESMLQRAVQQAMAPRPAAVSAAQTRYDPTLVMSGAPAAAAAPPPLRSAVLTSQLEALRLRYHDAHPEIQRLKLELEATLLKESQEAAAAAAVKQKETTATKASPSPKPTSPAPPAATETETPSAPPQLVADLNRERDRITATRTQLSFANRELQTRTADRQRILRNIAEYQAKLERLPMREQEMASITRDYENTKQYYHQLKEKKMSAELAAEMERRQQAERFTLQDPGRIPTQPIKPNRLILNTTAVAVGLVLALTLALLIEFRKNHFLGEWELPAGVVVLGRVPTIMIDAPAPPSLKGTRRRVGAGATTAIVLALTKLCMKAGLYV